IPNRDQLVKLSEASRPESLHDDRLRLESLEWLCNLPLRHGEPVKARLYFRTRSSVSEVSIGIRFLTLECRPALLCRSELELNPRPSLTRLGRHSIEVEMNSLPLAPDNYILDLGAKSGDSYYLDYICEATQIEIVAGSTTRPYIVGKNLGVCGVCNWS